MNPGTCLALNQRTEPLNPVKIFAGADRRAGGSRKTCHSVRLVRWERNLQPHWPNVLQCVQQLNRILGVVFPVTFNREVDLLAEVATHGFHLRDDATNVPIGQIAGVGIMSRLGVRRGSAHRNVGALKFESSEFVGIISLSLGRLIFP